MTKLPEDAETATVVDRAAWPPADEVVAQVLAAHRALARRAVDSLAAVIEGEVALRSPARASVCEALVSVVRDATSNILNRASTAADMTAATEAIAALGSPVAAVRSMAIAGTMAAAGSAALIADLQIFAAHARVAPAAASTVIATDAVHVKKAAAIAATEVIAVEAVAIEVIVKASAAPVPMARDSPCVTAARRATAIVHHAIMIVQDSVLPDLRRVMVHRHHVANVGSAETVIAKVLLVHHAVKVKADAAVPMANPHAAKVAPIAMAIAKVDQVRRAKAKAVAVVLMVPRAMATMARAVTSDVPMVRLLAMAPSAASAPAAAEMAHASATVIGPVRLATATVQVATSAPTAHPPAPAHAAMVPAARAAKAANAEAIAMSVAAHRATAMTTTAAHLALTAMATVVLKKTRPQKRPLDVLSR